MVGGLSTVAFAPPQADGQQPNFLVQLIPFAIIFVVFYFLVFAPMRRKQRKHTEMVVGLKAGDRVVTTGGIYGTVVGVSDQIVQLRIADQVKIEIAKTAVAGLQGSEE